MPDMSSLFAFLFALSVRHLRSCFPPLTDRIFHIFGLFKNPNQGKRRNSFPLCAVICILFEICGVNRSLDMIQ